MGGAVRIGTRGSDLALWQAMTVQSKIQTLGYSTILALIKSTGDHVLDEPLYEMGITGIFTKALDVALLNGQIDIAVHSMKDMPTQLPNGIVQAAVLERGSPSDILVHKGLGFMEVPHQGVTIATGSLRRKAQWLHRYPDHNVADLRGNVNTRLLKLMENDWQGAIFAQAGLERIKLMPKDALVLDWMVPAPAQGAIVVTTLENNANARGFLQRLNHAPSEIETQIEREFLRILEGGCTAPIGAKATVYKQSVHFKGELFSLDGKQKVDIQKSISLQEKEGFGSQCAMEVLEKGADVLIQKIRNENSALH